MFTLSLTVSASDIDRRTVELPCPRCRLSAVATLGDIRLGAFVICRGCKVNLRLSDHLGEYHRFKREYERIVQKMQQAIVEGDGWTPN